MEPRNFPFLSLYFKSESGWNSTCLRGCKKSKPVKCKVSFGYVICMQRGTAQRIFADKLLSFIRILQTDKMIRKCVVLFFNVGRNFVKKHIPGKPYAIFHVRLIWRKGIEQIAVSLRDNCVISNRKCQRQIFMKWNWNIVATTGGKLWDTYVCTQNL